MFQTQLLYELPEMVASVKVQIVVVRIAKLDRRFPKDTSASTMLNSFRSENMEPDGVKHYDLTALPVHRSLYLRGTQQIVGPADMYMFCKYPGAFVVQAESVNIAKLSAHELAHALGVPHDGEDESSNCEPKGDIMGGGSLWPWSSCSVDALTSYLRKPDVFACVFDETQIASARPLDAHFDWSPGQPGRTPWPGLEVPLDEQCRMAFGPCAKASLKWIRPNVEACQDLWCSIEWNLVAMNGICAWSPREAHSEQFANLFMWANCVMRPSVAGLCRRSCGSGAP